MDEEICFLVLIVYVLRRYKELVSLVCNLKLNKYDIVSLDFESF